MENTPNAHKHQEKRAFGRALFERGPQYAPSTICRAANRESKQYVDKLLSDKMETIRRHMRNGLVVDLCCATGDHLLAVKGDNVGIGIDTSLRYLKEAMNRAAVKRVRGVYFTRGDAANIPLETGTVQTLYSLSALYVIPDLSRVLVEISRVLQRGGRCILDLGNKHSLNAFCVSRYHHDIAPCYYFTVNQLLCMCKAQKLIPIEHRAYQILPLWTTRPSWLWPLLHPIWKRILGHRTQGRMIDEWICRLPLVRRFAFRHLITCKKC